MSVELLVVDDEADIREVLVDLIGNFFDKVHQAKDGQEALDILNSENISLIITDFNMPKLDGVELVKMIKNKHKNVPIIVLTGRGSEEVRKVVWAYGVWEYFEKPFDPKALQDCVKKVLPIIAEGNGTYVSPVRLLNFEEITVLLEKQISVPFSKLCVNRGLSPSSVIKELVVKYLDENLDENLD
jgi:DNA-binding response OmpR family regulator